MISTKSYRPVLIALAIMLLGLFMLCAHQQAIEIPGDDMTGGGDEEFREELLEMLDIANEGSETAEFEPAESSDPASQQSQDAVLASDASADTDDEMNSDEAELMLLLAELEGEASGVPYDDTPEETPEHTVASSKPLATGDYAYDELMSEVERLETILEQRSMQADSLHRIIDNRTARIRDLENNISLAKSRAPADNYVPEPVFVSEKTAKIYEPVVMPSGAFQSKYQAGRRQFESYDYSGCIATMTALLEEYRDHPMADNAQYWIGESYFGLKQYQKAMLEFQKVFAYDMTDKYDDAQLMTGLCYARLGQSEMARSTFGEFLDTYMGSEYTGVAQRYYYSI
jgi:TolA-binding protein